MKSAHFLLLQTSENVLTSVFKIHTPYIYFNSDSFRAPLKKKTVNRTQPYFFIQLFSMRKQDSPNSEICWKMKLQHILEENTTLGISAIKQEHLTTSGQHFFDN